MSNERDKTILELTELTSVDGVNDFIPIVDSSSGETKKVSPSNFPVSTEQQSEFDLKANDADLTAHTGDTSNPHNVTAAQVGLGNVDNTSDAEKDVSTAQQAALDLKANATALTTETNARIDADNRREFAGGVALSGSGTNLITNEILFQNQNAFTFSGNFTFNLGSANGVFGIHSSSSRAFSSSMLIRVYATNTEIVFRYYNGTGNYRNALVSHNHGGNILNIFISFDGTSAPEICINGVSKTVTESTVGSNPPDWTDAISGNYFIFGQAYSNNSKSKTVSDIAIFNTALTATQAAELYQQGLQPWLAANPEYRRGNAGSDLPLAVSNNAAAAYSLEWLGNPNYTGPYVRVRRGFDNAEQNFTDKSLIASWVGSGNDGFVHTLYDQSGNSNDATQSTAASQPKIVDGGVLVSDGIKFDGVDDHLTALISESQPISIYMVAEGDDSMNAYLGGTGSDFEIHTGGTAQYVIYSGTPVLSPTNVSTSGQALLTTIADGSNSIFRLNGTELVSGNAGTGGLSILNIGFVDRLNRYATDTIQEIIIYNSDQSANRAAIEANMANRYNISNVHKGSLATLPLDDDCRQLKDISGNRNDATASESGVTHLKQKDLHSFRDDHADGTGGSYLIANADIISENEVITGVTVDGRFYAASGDQDLTKRRIKLQDHGSHVDVKRSNGTTDDSAIAVTNPSDGTDFAITVLTQRI